MKHNEPHNASAGTGEADILALDPAMTPEELRLYREILEAAYPQPKRSIKAGVMEAIRLETYAYADEDDAKILLPRAKDAAKKKNLRNLFIKWGSLAASIVLVAGIGIRVLPTFLSKDITANETAYSEAMYDSLFTADGSGVPTDTTSAISGIFKTTVSSADDSAVSNEAENETAAEIYAADDAFENEQPAEDTVLYAAQYAAEAVNGLPESLVAAAEEAVAAENYTDTNLPLLEEAPANAPVPDSTQADLKLYAVPPTAPVVTCPHAGVFRDSYHQIPEYLIAEAGEEAYYAWAAEASKENPCAVNIYTFLTHFGISETAFAMYLSSTDIAYLCDYPLDILYESSAAEVEAYYLGGGQYDRMLADYFEYEFKRALANEIGTTAYTQWLTGSYHPAVRSWPISQFVRDHGITEERFFEIYEKTVQSYTAEHEGFVPHEYDAAKLYFPNAEVKFALAASTTGYSADVQCRK